MFGLGVQELLLILVIILVLFGGKKIPELSKSIGESIRELRKGISGDMDDKETKTTKTKQTKESA